MLQNALFLSNVCVFINGLAGRIYSHFLQNFLFQLLMRESIYYHAEKYSWQIQLSIMFWKGKLNSTREAAGCSHGGQAISVLVQSHVFPPWSMGCKQRSKREVSNVFLPIMRSISFTIALSLILLLSVVSKFCILSRIRSTHCLSLCSPQKCENFIFTLFSRYVLPLHKLFL